LPEPKKKVLVTGGRGFIGSNLVKELKKRGHEVWICDLMHSEMENYIRCDVSKYRQVSARALNAKMKNATLTLSSNSARLVLLFNNRTAYSINGTRIILKAKSLNVYLRKPQITVNGKGIFIDLYTYSELYKRKRVLGTDCEIDGYFSFTGIYGDTYTIAKQFDYNGNVKLSDPLYEFDDLQSLVGSIPYLIIIVICYIAFTAMKTWNGENE